MDRARPGTWFTRGYFDDGVDKVQFDCCKEQMYCSLSTVRAFRHCPFCGCKLTNQRAVRPSGVSASMWKGTFTGTITPTYYSRWSQQYYWSIERKCIDQEFNYVGDWVDYQRCYPGADPNYRRSALADLRQTLIDAEAGFPSFDEYYRLVYRTSDRVIGVVQRPNWVVKKFISKEMAE